MLNAKLVVVGGDAKKTEVRLKLPTVIGRGKEAGLTVPHELVSRRHTEIIERDGQLFVRDLGSLNGTFINNTRIEGEQPLEPNQLLTLGNITFRAVYEVNSNIQSVGAPDSETVSDDEMKTRTGVDEMGPIQVQTAAGKAQLSSISDVIAFDETVPVDLIPSKIEPVDASNSTSTEETEQPIEKQPEPSERPTEPVLVRDEPKASKSAADTDKSFVDATTSDGLALGSSIFSIETDEVDEANKSVSASAINSLPSGQSAVNFVDGIETGEANAESVSRIHPDDIDLGENAEKSRVETDSTLGSFLKKLPR